MSVDAEDDRLHLPESGDPAFRDSVTFAFGDAAARLYGLARVSHGADGANGLAVLYAGSEPVAARAGGGTAGADPRRGSRSRRPACASACSSRSRRGP